MKITDHGVLPQSSCFSFIPSDAAKQMLCYPTWCGHYYCTNEYRIDRKDYPAVLLMFMRKGTMNFFCRDREYAAHIGDLVLIDGMDYHWYQTEDGAEFVYINFSGIGTHEIAQYLLDQHGPLIRRDNNVRIGDAIQSMVHFYEQERIETMFDQAERIYHILALLAAPEHAQARDMSIIEQTTRYMHEHLSEPISLDDLAAVSNYSVYYFSHLFKREIGYSPTEYLIKLRIEAAQVLLVQSSLPIGSIAERVGYQTSSSFINMFTRKVGLSPREYRKMHRTSARPT
ncbi:MAG: helix-turn-helix domain-containing protein [Butyricicoccaceae bacterium]